MTVDNYIPAAEPAMLTPATDSWTMVLHDVAELARLISDTDFVPKDLRGNVGKVAAVILHGRELGLPPMTALSQTAVINGRPSMSAEALRGLVLAAGHDIVFDETSSSRCVVRGRRNGSDNWTKVEWTSADADRAGLSRKDTYKAYPRAMLAARATAELVRLQFADVMHGMKAVEEADDYTPDQNLPPEAVEAPVKPQPVRRQPRTQPAPATAQAAPEPAPPPTPRKRAEIKPRTTTPPPTTDEPATTPEPPTEPVPAGRANLHQTQAIVMHMERLGVNDRTMRIALTAELVGRPITSTNDLDELEAAMLIDRLSHLRDRDALEQAINAPTLEDA